MREAHCRVPSYIPVVPHSDPNRDDGSMNMSIRMYVSQSPDSQCCISWVDVSTRIDNDLQISPTVCAAADRPMHVHFRYFPHEYENVRFRIVWPPQAYTSMNFQRYDIKFGPTFLKR